MTLGTAVESDAALPLDSLALQGTSQVVEFRSGPGALFTPSQAEVIVLTPILQQAPCVLQFRVVNADPGAILTFSSYNYFASEYVLLWTDVAGPDGDLDITSIDLPADFHADSYTLDLDTVNNGSSYDEYQILADPIAYPIDATGDEPPQLIPDSAERWVFQDLHPSGIGSWVLPVNPGTMTNPHFERNVNVRHSTSPYGGQVLVGEGAFTGKAWRLSGYCPDKEYYDQLELYANLRRRLYVIDHRGRAWKCGVQALTVEPRKRQEAADGTFNDWAGNWTMDLVIYDQTPSDPIEVP